MENKQHRTAETNLSNSLYLGDNLEVLDSIPDNSIDLIYLDPPFNSKRDYNIIFKSEMGIPIDQKTAFEDTWKFTAEMSTVVNEFMENINKGKYSYGLEQLMSVWIKALQKTYPEMLAYLVTMTLRLDKLQKKLKPTGNLFFHCDPTASHYVKIVLDNIFGKDNFRNEIVWCYDTAGRSKRYFQKKHDIIFFYSKAKKNYYFDGSTVTVEMKAGKKSFGGRLETDEDGRVYRLVYGTKNSKGEAKYYKYYLDEGKIPNDWWEDILPVKLSKNDNYLGYPTQKPLALLERIINSSCPEEGIVLDPFCGCGTSIEAAHKLNRSWIGIDVCKYAVDKIMERIEKYGLQRQKDFDVYNYPFVFDHIERLLQQQQGRYIFQDWAVEHVGGISSRKKSGDHGIDGTLYFFTSMESNNLGKMILSVKSDKKLQAQYIRDLIGTMNNQQAEMAGLISYAEPTEGMKLEAVKAGTFEVDMGTWGKQTFPRVQLLTVKNLFEGKTFDTPPTRRLG